MSEEPVFSCPQKHGYITIKTPYGTFSIKTYRRSHKFVCIWLNPSTEEYLCTWHHTLTNIEQSDKGYGYRYQLIAVYQIFFIEDKEKDEYEIQFKKFSYCI